MSALRILNTLEDVKKTLPTNKDRWDSLHDTAQEICVKNGVFRVIAIAQIARLLKKWIASHKNRKFIDEINKVIKYEIIRRGNSYYCERCKREHHTGKIYYKHQKHIITPSQMENRT